MKAHDAASLRPKAAGVRKLIRAVIFILLLGLILGRMQYMFTRKESKKKLARFFQEQAGFDVLFTGISHMETGVSPMELYNDYGITSFNFGESGARLPFAYWTLRNALDYCSPKLVVIDVRRIDLEDKEADPYVRTNFDYFPLTKTKAEAVWDLFDGFEDRLSYLFPLIAYHDRWQELRRSDFGNIQYRIDNGTFYYGKAELAVFDPVHHSYVEPELVYKPGAVGEEYLRRMIELCQGKGIEVLLVELPFPGTRRDQRFANSVQAIADEYGVNFLNYHHIEGVVDYDTDMTNQTHVNDSGMHKTTYSIGRFITDHYDLPDRRRDSAYASWTQQYNKKFTEYKYKRIGLREEPDVFLMTLADRRVDTYIHIKRGASLYENETIVRLLKNICLKKDLKRIEKAVEKKAEYRALIINSRGESAESYSGDPVSGTIGRYHMVFDEAFPEKVVLSNAGDEEEGEEEPAAAEETIEPEIEIQVFNSVTGDMEIHRWF